MSQTVPVNFSTDKWKSDPRKRKSHIIFVSIPSFPNDIPPPNDHDPQSTKLLTFHQIHTTTNTGERSIKLNVLAAVGPTGRKTFFE